MSFDISEIKKLPVEEKRRIINELWESIEEDEDCEEESPEIISFLEERIAKTERGEEKFFSMEEVRTMLDKKSAEIKNDKPAKPGN